MWRSLRGGTLSGRSTGRSLHGGDAFFCGKTPKIAEKLRILAIFRVFCGKTRLFANFVGNICVFSQKKGGASAKKIIIYFFPRRASRDALCVEHVKSVKDALYVCRSARRSFEKLRYAYARVYVHAIPSISWLSEEKCGIFLNAKLYFRKSVTAREFLHFSWQKRLI